MDAPRTATIARLQRALVIALVLAAVACLAVILRQGWPAPLTLVVALVVALLLLLPHAPVLALEFILQRRQQCARGDMPATWRATARAWLAEIAQGLRVFAWRQPFREWAVPDRQGPLGHVGVLLVHGLMCNRGFWAPWQRSLDAHGVPHIALSLREPFAPIERYAAELEQAAARLREATGRNPVVVAHSMGGLAVRAWLAGRADSVGSARGPGVQHVVTIGSPHHGTWLARLAVGANGRQMREGSAWLAALAASEAAAASRVAPPPFTCFYSDLDNVVFPPRTATLPGADNRHVAGAAHVELAFRPEVLARVLALVAEANASDGGG